MAQLSGRTGLNSLYSVIAQHNKRSSRRTSMTRGRPAGLGAGWALALCFLALWGHAWGQHFVVNQPAGQMGAGADAGIFGADPESALRAGLGNSWLDQSDAGYSSNWGLSERVERVKAAYSWAVDGAKIGLNSCFDVLEDFLTNGVFSGSVGRATWFCSIVGALSVVFCGVLPAFVIPFEIGSELHQEGKARNSLNCLLSFSIGCLLGDVFLHLLPETWSHSCFDANTSGLWIIAGLLCCFLVEKCCTKTEDSQHQVTAAMNLLANMVDNFTHGLAIGGSFLISIRFGCLTTFAILLHEIPHEISDFAILLRADFNRWSAVKAQRNFLVGDSNRGILGAAAALLSESGALESKALWILPFTAGGFLNIALVQVLPELMQETSRRENVKHIVLVLAGIGVMAVLNCAFQF